MYYGLYKNKKLIDIAKRKLYLKCSAVNIEACINHSKRFVSIDEIFENLKKQGYRISKVKIIEI